MAEQARDSTTERMIAIVSRLTHDKLGDVASSSDGWQRLLDLNLVDDLGLDSVQILDLLMTVEEEFNVQLDSEQADLDKLMSVSALVDYVCKENRALSPP
jgi:acyl carrier protein